MMILALAVLLWIVYSYARLPSTKGRFGEWRVRGRLAATLRPPRFVVFNNLLIEGAKGPTQIDHVVVCPAGVFVIETKTLSGLIKGNAVEPEWRQRRGTTWIRFQNPLFQNHGHVRAVEEVTGLRRQTVFSVVVFAGDGELSRDLPANVVGLEGLVPYILAEDADRLSNDEQHRICAVFRAARDATTDVRTAHTQRVNAALANAPAPAPKCPACGGRMAKRVKKRGSDIGALFWGCPQFPACRGYREIHDTGPSPAERLRELLARVISETSGRVR